MNGFETPESDEARHAGILSRGVESIVGLLQRDTLGEPLAARSKRWHQHLVALSVLVAIIGGLYLPVLLGHASLRTNSPWPTGPLFVADPDAGGPLTLPFEHVALVAWEHFRLPVIDPYQAYGLPLLPNQGVPVFPPELIFHALLPSNPSIWIVAALVLMAYGTYLLAASLGQTMPASLACGILVVLAGFVPPNLNMGMLNAAAVLPFVLLSLRYLLDPTSRYVLAASLGCSTSMAMLCLSGFQEALPLEAITIFVLAVACVIRFETIKLGSKRIYVLLVSSLAGAITGLVGLLPVFSAIGQGSTLNAASLGSYRTAEPLYWLATVFLPSITGKEIAGQPLDLGHTVCILGTPILLLVIVLAAFVMLRMGGRSARWYGWPCFFLAIFGLLGYVDAFGILEVFKFFPFDLIVMVRLLPFVWWLPICLLVGIVISNVRCIRLPDLLSALAAAIASDLFIFYRFRAALIGDHLSDDLRSTTNALVVAAIFLVAFALAGALARWSSAAPLLMAAIVLSSAVYYLPTNFFSSAGNLTTSRIAGLYAESGLYSTYGVGAFQLPATTFSLQLWGPIVPKAYDEVVGALVQPSQTSNGASSVDTQAPTLYFAKLTPAFVGDLRELGVSDLLTPTILPAAEFPSVRSCVARQPAADQRFLCLAGTGRNEGGATHQVQHIYSILGASPVIDPVSRVVPVAGEAVGLKRTLKSIRTDPGSLSKVAFVTGSVPGDSTARGAVALRRTSTSQSVSIELASRSSGLVVLRQDYLPGMRASVNGRAEPALPVDGGLWTAVRVPEGLSHVSLNYLTLDDAVEFALAGLGLFLLLLAWCALAVTRARQSYRRGRKGGSPTIGSGDRLPTDERGGRPGARVSRRVRAVPWYRLPAR